MALESRWGNRKLCQQRVNWLGSNKWGCRGKHRWSTCTNGGSWRRHVYI